MIDAAARWIVGEGNWLPAAMGIAAIAAGAALRHGRLISMHVFTGVTLVVMGLGHVLAVTTKLWQGTLTGSPALLYAIGAAILAPSVLLVRHARGSRAAAWNGWLAAALIALGLVNIPLAIPALLNIAYSRHRRPLAGRVIIGAWLLVNLTLFAGGMAFMLSGARTFEEFSTM
jgi:hypothetical protein